MDCSHSDWNEMVPHCGFDLHFSDNEWCWASFHVFVAIKSLQSCPTLCNPIDSSPPGSPVPGILQARVLEWGAISFSNAWKWKLKVKLLSPVQLLATPWTASFQALLSMGFSRQEYWRGVPLPLNDIKSLRSCYSLLDVNISLDDAPRRVSLNTEWQFHFLCIVRHNWSKLVQHTEYTITEFKKEKFIFLSLKILSVYHSLCSILYVEDLGSISRSGRSPGEGNGNPLQYSCLENPMDRRAW